jgi:hypothetical protein
MIVDMDARTSLSSHHYGLSLVWNTTIHDIRHWTALSHCTFTLFCTYTQFPRFVSLQACRREGVSCYAATEWKREKINSSQRRRSGIDVCTRLTLLWAIMAGSSVAFTEIKIPRTGWLAGQMGFLSREMVTTCALAWSECKAKRRNSRQLVFFPKTFSSNTIIIQTRNV